MRIPRWSLALGLAAPVFFLFLGRLWIDRPGPQHDEALFVHGIPESHPGAVAWEAEILGRGMPVMVMSYVGALKSWLYGALLAVFPATVATMRAPMIAVAALSVLFAFLFTNRILGWPAALLAVWLTASDPSYLFTSRFDWGPVAIQHLCLMLGCYLGIRWVDSRNPVTLAGAAFVFGLGLFDKVSFHWLIAALALSLIVLFPRRVFSEFRTRSVPVAVIFFLIGCSPYLLYRMQPDAEKPAVEIETSPQEYRVKYWTLWKAFNGTALNGWLTPLEAPVPAEPDSVLAAAAYTFMEPWRRPTWTIPALFGSILLLPLALRTRHRKGLLFCLLVPLLALAQMVPVRAAGAVHHSVLVFPFPQMFLAGTLVALTEITRRERLRRALIATSAGMGLFLVATNTASVMHQYAQVLHFGGAPYWSEAIYNLLNYLEKERPAKTFLVEWGMETQLEFLSGAQLQLVGLPEPGPGTARTIEEGLQMQGSLFVTYASDKFTDYPESHAFLAETAGRAGYRLNIKQTIPDYHGRTIYNVYEAVPAANDQGAKAEPPDQD